MRRIPLPLSSIRFFVTNRGVATRWKPAIVHKLGHFLQTVLLEVQGHGPSVRGGQYLTVTSEGPQRPVRGNGDQFSALGQHRVYSGDVVRRLIRGEVFQHVVPENKRRLRLKRRRIDIPKVAK